MRHRSASTAIALLLTSEVSAGPLLDYIRSYDLNDYAIGIAVTVEQNPYTGADNSTFAYPFLTSFSDSSMTDDWLLIRDGDVGLRWISGDSNWELGLVGRVQTLGLGDSDAEELEGINDREWALEAGPMAGWRGWPIHIDVKSYFEISDRHSGQVSELAMSWPISLSRGYFVPSIGVVHQDSDYVDYYYGVRPASATPIRPAYEGRSANNVVARARWGYALSNRWLLSGAVGYQWLDDSVTDSSIVDSDGIWSAQVGVAYNADIFRPRESSYPVREAPAWEIRVGAFQDNVSTKVARDTSDGIPGFETDIENILGAADEETVLQIDANVRIGRYHRLEIGYFELVRDSSISLGREVRFGDLVFPEGTTLTTDVDLSVFRAGYSYSLIRDFQKELGITAGLHVADFDVSITNSETGQSERSGGDTPMPFVGAHAAVFIGKRTTVSGKLQIFRTDFDRFDGSLAYATLDLQYRVAESINVGLGYNFYAMKLSSDQSSVNGYLKVRHHGPMAFLSLGF